MSLVYQEAVQGVGIINGSGSAGMTLNFSPCENLIVEW